MQDLKLGLEGDNNQILDYLVDNIIIEGLYITGDNSKIRANCTVFNIRMTDPISDNQIANRITKINNVSILTIKSSDENLVQFLIGNDLDIEEMKSLPREMLSREVEDLIQQAYMMASFKL